MISPPLDQFSVPAADPVFQKNQSHDQKINPRPVPKRKNALFRQLKTLRGKIDRKVRRLFCRQQRYIRKTRKLLQSFQIRFQRRFFAAPRRRFGNGKCRRSKFPPFALRNNTVLSRGGKRYGKMVSSPFPYGGKVLFLLFPAFQSKGDRGGRRKSAAGEKVHL